jgi:hypothetical protein
MFEKEKIIKEQRLKDANRNGYLGLEGKFGCILKYLGQPILTQGSLMYESSPFIDVWDLPEDDEMPELDMDDPSIEIGRHFDGLPYNVHLEIKYIGEEKKLLVTYKGYMVYCETEGDLECYVPNKEWERKIDDIYSIAKIKEQKHKESLPKEKKEARHREKMNFLEEIKRKWGFSLWN